MSNTPTDVIAAERPSAGGAADGRRTAANPIKALQRFGQSVWLDYLRRSLFTSGEFSRLIMEDGLRGVTSNPSIFEKAIAGSADYLDALQDIERRGDLEPMALYEALAIRDVLSAALFERFGSRGHADFADQLLSAMRYQFGGHLEKGHAAGSDGKEDGS